MEMRYGIDAWSTLDFRLESSGDGRDFTGYAAVFDQLSEDLGGFREVLEPGCFKRSLNQRKRDLKAFVNHEWGRLLATRKAGTLELGEDGYGLRSHIPELPDTSDGNDVAVLAARGDIFAMSFGFRPKDVQEMDGGKIRRVREAELFEVSPVTSWPAYNATSASVRHLAEMLDVEDEAITDALRALAAPAGELTPEQHDLLMRAIEVRSPQPVEPPASLVERMEAFRAATALA